MNRLLRQLLNDERIVQKLQDSAPIRAAAKAAVTAWHKGKVQVDGVLDKLKESEGLQKLADKVEEKIGDVQDALEKVKDSEIIKKLEDKEAKETTYDQWKKRISDDIQKKPSKQKKS